MLFKDYSLFIKIVVYFTNKLVSASPVLPEEH